MPSEFYKKVFRECEPFLKEGTERFLNRQIVSHLSKTPETFSPADKELIARWIRISASLFLKPQEAESLAQRIRLLR